MEFLRSSLVTVKKILQVVLGTKAGVAYIVLFALSIGVATFIENDFGTDTAQKVVYRSLWFSVLLVLFCISILNNIIKFKMVSRKKWALMLFHLAMVVILVGSAVTMYTGFEGIMHIREGATSSEFMSAEYFLQFKVSLDGQTYSFKEPVLFASLGSNDWSQSYQLGSKRLDVEVVDFIPNPTQETVSQEGGEAMIKLVIAGANGREEYYLKEGQSRRLGDLFFNFGDRQKLGAINISNQDGQLKIVSDQPMTSMVMATQ